MSMNMNEYRIFAWMTLCRGARKICDSEWRSTNTVPSLRSQHKLHNYIPDISICVSN